MNNNSNIILLLISIIIIILASVSYLEFKKIKIELDKHKEILSNYKVKIELLLNLNKNIIQEQSQQQFHQEESPQQEKDIIEEVYINNQEVHIPEEQNIEEVDKNTISINFDNLDDILVNISSDDDNEPIEEIFNNKELFEKYKKVSVKDLRKILMEKELPLSGNKTTLVNRILNNL